MMKVMTNVTDQMVFLSPYENPFYFIILSIGLIPLVIQLVRGKRMMWYQNLLTIFFLWTSFGGPSIRQGVALLSYIAWQTLLVWVYFKHRQTKNSNGTFYTAVILAIMPLFLVKVIPFVLGLSVMEAVVEKTPT